MSSLRTHDPVDEWLAYLAQRNRTPETIRTYRSTMSRFLSDPLHATPEAVEAWWRAQDELAVTSRRRLLATVRSFYRWALRFDLITADPTRRLDAPTQGRHLPKPMSRTDLHTVLANADPEMRRAVALGAYAGLRVAEAAALDWADVEEDTHRIIVRGGKGDKDRPVGMSPLLLDALAPNTGGNVVTAGGVPYSAGTLQRKVNRLITSTGVQGTFHKLRARFATVALADTGNLLAVSRALGHASPATTAIYALTSDADLDLIAAAVVR